MQYEERQNLVNNYSGLAFLRNDSALDVKASYLDLNTFITDSSMTLLQSSNVIEELLCNNATEEYHTSTILTQF